MKALVLGRFNIPHEGHIDLIRRGLEVADRVEVALSVSKSNSKSADWYLRVHAFTCLLSESELERISFTRWTNVVSLSGFTDSTVIIGQDNTSIIDLLLERKIVKEIIVCSKKESNKNIFYSSTRIRELVDKNIFFHENSKYFKVVLQIRSQEIKNEYN